MRLINEYYLSVKPYGKHKWITYTCKSFENSLEMLRIKISKLSVGTRIKITHYVDGTCPEHRVIFEGKMTSYQINSRV